MYRRMQALFPRTMRQCYHHVSEIKKYYVIIHYVIVITQSFSVTRHHLSAIHVAPQVGAVLFVTMVLQIHLSPILKS